MLQPHEQRVVDEKAALDENITKLEAFIKGDLIKILEREDQVVLHEQFLAMKDYADALRRRIERFTA